MALRFGFGSRDSARRRIKMPDVFKALHNYYIGHTYTDIGNNFLNMYERPGLTNISRHVMECRMSRA